MGVLPGRLDGFLEVADIVYDDRGSSGHDLLERVHDPYDLSGRHPESGAGDAGVRAVPSKTSHECEGIFGIAYRVVGNLESLLQTVQRYRIPDEDGLAAPGATYGHLLETGVAIGRMTVRNGNPGHAGSAVRAYAALEPGPVAAIGRDGIDSSSENWHDRRDLKVLESNSHPYRSIGFERCQHAWDKNGGQVPFPLCSQ